MPAVARNTIPRQRAARKPPSVTASGGSSSSFRTLFRRLSCRRPPRVPAPRRQTRTRSSRKESPPQAIITCSMSSPKGQKRKRRSRDRKVRRLSLKSRAPALSGRAWRPKGYLSSIPRAENTPEKTEVTGSPVIKAVRSQQSPVKSRARIRSRRPPVEGSRGNSPFPSRLRRYRR